MTPDVTGNQPIGSVLGKPGFKIKIASSLLIIEPRLAFFNKLIELHNNPEFKKKS
jgi:hypothetical protein